MTAVRPLALIAVVLAGLFVLKALAILDGATQLFGATAFAAEEEDETGQAEQENEASAEAAGDDPAAEPDAAAAPQSGNSLPPRNEPRTSTELDLLERLAERRRALDAREAELDTREGLITVAEQRVEERIAELQALEADVRAIMNELEADRAEQIDAIVNVYSALEPDAAAAIMEQMYENDRETLLLVAEQLQRTSARGFAAVMGEMRPDFAARLTSMLHARAAPPETVADMEARLEAAGE
ncbi:hypothetical protein DDZ18_07710 [Marinicauda salina]|uniref:Magnesium transporter MgtE intracellular domain-containing protein n=1 Tax=Marinicauda salina TaxID=2135793 RepID=A0A2U2BU54_9PROT|nr:hypothetical protein [Marinicauda salina]PWE17548.1 hypothetical protein DDZ18_07710 [Marinicauda salina]